jgi:hypothetical protein
MVAVVVFKVSMDDDDVMESQSSIENRGFLLVVVGGYVNKWRYPCCRYIRRSLVEEDDAIVECCRFMVADGQNESIR